MAGDRPRQRRWLFGRSARGAQRMGDDLGRLLVAAQPQERRVAQRTVVGPLGIMDLGDEMRAAPDDAGTLRMVARHRRLLDADAVERLGQVDAILLLEAGADLAAETQVAPGTAV